LLFNNFGSKKLKIVPRISIKRVTLIIKTLLLKNNCLN
jgi:hypothetical protein